MSTKKITSFLIKPYYTGNSMVSIIRPGRLTLSGLGLESKKNAHLYSQQGVTFIRLNELGRVSK